MLFFLIHSPEHFVTSGRLLKKRWVTHTEDLVRINYLQWNIFQSSTHSRLIQGESSSFKSSGDSGPCRSPQSTAPPKKKFFFSPQQSKGGSNFLLQDCAKDGVSILTPGLCHLCCWLRDSSHERPADIWHQWLGLTYIWGNEAHTH